jgi:uncharacterized protein YneF (UPF0154 family)
MSIRLSCRLAACIVLACSMFVCGCFKNKVHVRVNKDGSADIVMTRIFSKEAVLGFEAQQKQMKKMMEDNPMAGEMESKMAKDPFYNEAALKRMAKRFGPGVTFVKAHKYDKDGARGAVAQYKVQNIDDMVINTQYLLSDPSMFMGMGMGMDEGTDDEAMDRAEEMMAGKGEAIDFSFSTGAVSKLTIQIPAYEVSNMEVSDEDAKEMDQPAFGGGQGGEFGTMMAMGNPYGFTGKETQGQVMRTVFKGMQAELSVEVSGEVVKSSAKFAAANKPGKYYLINLDMDRVFADPKSAKNFSPEQLFGDSPEEFLGNMSTIKGVMVETNRMVVIEFK